MNFTQHILEEVKTGKTTCKEIAESIFPNANKWHQLAVYIKLQDLEKEGKVKLN